MHCSQVALISLIYYYQTRIGAIQKAFMYSSITLISLGTDERNHNGIRCMKLDNFMAEIIFAMNCKSRLQTYRFSNVYLTYN